MTDIFISYRRSDSAGHARFLHDRLSRYFDPERIFFDRESIDSGDIFPDRLRSGVSEAKAVLVLIAPDWLTVKGKDGASRLDDKHDYVRQEIAQALALGKKIIPILIDDAPFPKTGELPDCLKGLTKHDTLLLRGKTFDYDAGLKSLVGLLRRLPGMPPPKVPFMVEQLSDDFVPRLGEFNQLLSHFLDSKGNVVVGNNVALKGGGGFGKTTLAKAICHNEDVQNAFDDGILWVTLGETPGDLIGKIEDLIYILSREKPGFKTIDAAVTRFGELLAERSVLIVIDDVWNAAHLKPFLLGGPRCARLITTRNSETLPPNARKIDVDVMKMQEAVTLLGAGLPIPEEVALARLAKRLGEWPMLLKLVNGALRERVESQGQALPAALSYVNSALDKRGLIFFDVRNAEERNQAVGKTLSVSFELLSGDEYERFTELAVFPEDTDLPLEVVEKLWGATGALDAFDAEALCERFFRFSLLLNFDPTTRRIRLHDVIRLYLVEQRTEPISQLHQRLLLLYRPANGWPSLPANESYIWNHLAYHLAGAKDDEQLRALFADEHWLHARVAQSGYIYSGYLSDLTTAWGMADNRVDKDEQFLADCFRYALIRSSINSLASNFDPELVARAVELSLWSSERALSVAEKIPDPEQASQFFSRLLCTGKLNESQRIYAEEKALAAALAIGNEESQAKALAAVAPQLGGERSGAALEKAFGAILAIENQTRRTGALAAVARQLSGERNAAALDKVLDTALAIGEEEFRAHVLTAMAPQLSGERNAAALDKALDAAMVIGNERLRVEALVAVAPQLSEQRNVASLEKALAALLAIGDERSRAYVAYVLANMAPQLSGERQAAALERALEVALVIGDEESRAHVLATVAPQLSGEQQAAALENALAAALAIGNEEPRAYALAAVAPRLSGERNAAALQKVREAVLALADERLWAEALAAMAPRLSRERDATALKQILEAALAIGDESLRADALVAVAPQLSEEHNAPALEKAIDAALAIGDEVSRGDVLAALAPQLSEQRSAATLEKTREAALAIGYELPRAKALAAVAPQLSGERSAAALGNALEAALAIGHEVLRVEALVAVALQLSGERNSAALEKAIEAALAIGNQSWRAKIWAAVAPQLSGERNADALEKALDAALAIRDEESRAKALAAVAPRLSGARNAAALEKALDAALAIADESRRAEALVDVALQLSGERNSAAREMVIEAALAITNESWRARILASVARLLDGEHDSAVRDKTLEAVLAIRDESWRAEILAAMEPARNAAALERALGAALAIEDEIRRAEALADVARQLNWGNSVKLEKILGVLLAIGDEKSVAYVLDNMVQQLTEVNKALDAALPTRDEESRAKALVAVAPRLSGARTAVLPQLHQLEDSVRSSVLDFCTETLPRLPLNVETADRISEHIIDICFTWRWL